MLELMAAASTVCQLDLLHMWLLQLWLKACFPFYAWHVGLLRILVTCECLDAMAPWRSTAFYEQGVIMGQLFRVAMADHKHST